VVRQVSRGIGIMQSSRELSVLDQEELRKIMDDLVQVQHDFSVSKDAV